MAHFNPRTPCGVRRENYGNVAYNFPISIHAPRVGCDAAYFPEALAAMNFNPRTPCGVRLQAGQFARLQLRFQSTHPVWGATSTKEV